ncbi:MULTISPECIES: tRNA (N6-threonylcarbamoyladenosine(37)-N6)-methyltransferase TrmO [unclassified Fibrobacter]|uniref:tRNA (N6-threonylcarbamoyladenosine(37)-N6)-methyltransferase TrmO n=1 Tax=unclassified Fibrobacter TaxID=2634177 RepID=UPI00156437AF|nr:MULTISPECIES: tRNA (N6-threonylcarbamoyladenosine(37)-N6)-methyltransferase TrmO [unclassified Fibrobacter]
MDSLELKVIARIESDFPEKFGIPRQSGIVPALRSTIRFEPEFRNADALRGLDGFSHLWLLWIFSENVRDTWKPTVRPPRLGGNTRLGVFATRSSFRPNPIAMSCVKIEEIRLEGCDGPEIVVSGADLMDGTPIVDIKPYLPYADAISDAKGGFATAVAEDKLPVVVPAELADALPAGKMDALREVLAQDPRPHYQDDPERIYGFPFAGKEIKFKVNEKGLSVVSIA